MNCFYGNYGYQLDAKNRMRMPSKFRADMGKEYLITLGAGGCLIVLHQQLLETLNQKMSQLPLTDVEGSKAIRAFTAFGENVECDEQGRFILPQELKKYAKIDKDVRIVGAGNKVEIWSQEVWTANNKEFTIESYENALDGLSKYGI
ncbi:MAG: division/cell wall cluster transcriptional repressor MraZ [Clostridia bacterium]